jgi:hypothetical protein
VFATEALHPGVFSIPIRLQEPVVKYAPVREFAPRGTLQFEFLKGVLEEPFRPRAVEDGLRVSMRIGGFLVNAERSRGPVRAQRADCVIVNGSSQETAKRSPLGVCLAKEFLAEHLLAEEPLHQVLGVLVAESHGPQIAVDGLPVGLVQFRQEDLLLFAAENTGPVGGRKPWVPSAHGRVVTQPRHVSVPAR